MTIAYVGIGSNLDPAPHVRAGVAALRAEFGAVTCSPVYETAPVGFEGPAFYNLVVRLETDRPLAEVVQRLRAIEDRQGRDRAAGGGFGNRSLDLDLLLFGECVTREPVTLPRRDVLAYPFVLKPLVDLDPAGRHPELDRTFAELWAEFPGDPDLRPVPLAL
ncbi:MAG TPA: 2-amino-4-hydroxy-6-hydroxymethyldihydropteridine diphosphokinase [Gammaproteobacteria bacterium]|nr:2-amino-4-hydroxy-6-hydroxymethyldihydropteridine diphosphokinase [Gammaproteobacteria bacterium]